MTTLNANQLDNAFTKPTRNARRTWGWFLALGILQILVGILAVSFAFSATIASVVTLGVLCLVAAGAQFAAAFWVRPVSRSLLFFLLSILYAVAGFLLFRHPLIAAEGLTLMLAALFLVGGTYRIVAALAEGVPGWGWVVCNGIISVLLGILIWQQWPVSGLWVLGTFVGIDLLMNGTSWIALAGALRKSPARTTVA
jgi:uncharacterized membrane protein HdeD (DUF308 family)